MEGSLLKRIIWGRSNSELLNWSSLSRAARHCGYPWSKTMWISMIQNYVFSLPLYNSYFIKGKEALSYEVLQNTVMLNDAGNSVSLHWYLLRQRVSLVKLRRKENFGLWLISVLYTNQLLFIPALIHYIFLLMFYTCGGSRNIMWQILCPWFDFFVSELLLSSPVSLFQWQYFFSFWILLSQKWLKNIKVRVAPPLERNGLVCLFQVKMSSWPEDCSLLNLVEKPTVSQISVFCLFVSFTIVEQENIYQEKPVQYSSLVLCSVFSPFVTSIKLGTFHLLLTGLIVIQSIRILWKKRVVIFLKSPLNFPFYVFFKIALFIT